METDERLQRMETDSHEMQAAIPAITVSLAARNAPFPHVATKAEGEEAKHEATQGQAGVWIGVPALLLSVGTLGTKCIGE